jgi:hypothetical protein
MNILSSFLPKSIAGYSADILLLIVVFAAAIIYGMWKGKKRLTSAILSFYPATLIYLNIPSDYLGKTQILGTSPSTIFYAHLILFLVIFLFIHIFINTYDTGSYSYASGGGAIETALLSVVALALFIIFIMHIVPISPVYAVNLPFFVYFDGPHAFFIWLVLPLIALYFI